MIHNDLQTPVINELSENKQVILPFEATGEYYVESLGEIDPKPVYNLLKRIFDIAMSLIMMIVLLPLMLIIGIVICSTSGGGVLYFQKRLGLNHKTIDVIKFRTMRSDAEKDGARWSGGDDDPRITPIGRILRKTRLDELPQLWCIFRGDMTFVGPRPERECFYEEFEKYVHGFHERLKVKPGLTGLAQVSGGYDLKPEEKIIFDIEYIKNRSLLSDIKIMLRTVAVVFTHNGAK